jgi:hypothetical protein
MTLVESVEESISIEARKIAPLDMETVRSNTHLMTEVLHSTIVKFPGVYEFLKSNAARKDVTDETWQLVVTSISIIAVFAIVDQNPTKMGFRIGWYAKSLHAALQSDMFQESFARAFKQ